MYKGIQLDYVEIDGKRIANAPAGKHCDPSKDCWQEVKKTQYFIAMGPLKEPHASVSVQRTPGDSGNPYIFLYKKSSAKAPTFPNNVKPHYVHNAAENEVIQHYAVFTNEPGKVTWTGPITTEKKDKSMITLYGLTGLKKEDQVLFTGRLENQERKMLIKYKNGKTYNVRIIPIPMAGKTSVSFIDNAKGSTPAEEPVPKDRTAQIAGQNTVRVLWKPPADTSQCGNKYLVIVKNETFQDKATVTDTKYVLSNMNPASVYIFNIHATDKQGKPFNASASIKVRLSKTQYTTVKDLSVSKVNGSAIKVSWSKPVPADKFKDE
ncbi:unnamed protein product, partial [Dibothriocephalus latus]